MGARWPEPDPLRMRDWLAIGICLAGLLVLWVVLVLNRIFGGPPKKVDRKSILV